MRVGRKVSVGVRACGWAHACERCGVRYMLAKAWPNVRPSSWHMWLCDVLVHLLVLVHLCMCAFVVGCTHACALAFLCARACVCSFVPAYLRARARAHACGHHLA